MADTFSNDLRLRLQESGSNAGTWGDLLNGTITNIASALGQGSEAIPNASTHTITLADGTADEARSLYLKCTGGGQACTVTLAPNTISKVWIIDNATSYTLTFSQGSGANVAIAAGAVKVIATDGAGSGAAVVDTLAGLEGSLSTLAVTGKITANAGIDIDNINIDGTTIALSSGDLTLDASGDIILDADGGDVNFKDAGTEYLRVTNGASGPAIFSTSNDGDLFLKGVDGGATITALTLDMSAAGAATFNAGVFAGSASSFPSITVNNNSYIGSANNATAMQIATSGAATFNSTITSPFLSISNATADKTALVSSFRAGADNDNNRANIFIGQNGNSRGMLLRAGRQDGDRAIAQFILNGSGNTIGSNIINFLESYQLAGTAYETTFNQDGENVDFRVESDGNANMLFVDAGTNRVGVGTNSPITDVHISGGAPTRLLLQMDGDTAGGEAQLQFKVDSQDTDARIKAAIIFRRDDPGTRGTGSLNFAVNGDNNDVSATTAHSRLTIESTGSVIINPQGADADFRVESDTQSHALFVDASNGLVNINTTDTSVANNTGSARGINLGFGYIEVAAYQDTVLYLNRMNNDGTIVDLRQNGSTEGTISVAGSTVNYNGFAGRHESSGIATSTARGTVVSTIDELDTYPANSNKAGQTRADHAKVKVSDSVGDARVYGVVGDFDENDKLFVVSVGIASVKVTGSCSGGDLLESNGDGTAKVQSDNLIKSSTIGKVTIRNSDTGVKLVSCVLYCG